MKRLEETYVLQFKKKHFVNTIRLNNSFKIHGIEVKKEYDTIYVTELQNNMNEA